MSIQFRCPACEQPIEVDDEWAGRLVACPYCRKTVAAPVESVLTDAAPPPLAKPADATADAAPWAAYAGAHAGPPNQRANMPAILALLFACATLGLLVIGSVIMAPAVEGLVEPNATADQMQAAVNEALRAGEPALVTGSLLMLAAMLTWMVAVVLGLVGLGHARRRGFAIAALVLCMLPLLMVVSQFLMM